MKTLTFIINVCIFVSFNASSIFADDLKTEKNAINYPRVSTEAIRKFEIFNNLQSTFHLKKEDCVTSDEIKQVMESLIYNSIEDIKNLYTLDELKIIILFINRMVSFRVLPEYANEVEKVISELSKDL